MNHRLLLKLAAVDTQSSLNGNQSQPAARTSSMTVGGRARAVAGGIQRLVLVVGCWAYTVWRFVARIGGVEVKSSALPGAGRGTGWGGGASKWKSSEEREGRRRGGVLFLSCRPSVSFCLSASQRCGLPAGSPRDLASLGLCEHRGGNRWGVWPVQLGPCGGRRGCWCQAAGCDWSSYTWEGRVRTISSIFYFPIKL